jgi:hypothetical protein
MSWPEQEIRSKFSGAPAGTLSGNKPNLIHSWEQRSGIEVKAGGSWVRLDEHLRSKQADPPAPPRGRDSWKPVGVSNPGLGSGRQHIGGQQSDKAVGVLFLIGIACLLVYAIVRLSIYGSGLLWIPAVVLCAPAWLRVSIHPRALQKHDRFAWTAVWTSLVPLAAYALAWCFDMTENSFPFCSFSLGEVLLASGATCLVAGGATLSICRLHRRWNTRNPNGTRGHGSGPAALSRRTRSNIYSNYLVDAGLALSSLICFFLGGTFAQLGALILAMLAYTWCWDFGYRDEVSS